MMNAVAAKVKGKSSWVRRERKAVVRAIARFHWGRARLGPGRGPLLSTHSRFNGEVAIAGAVKYEVVKYSEIRSGDSDLDLCCLLVDHHSDVMRWAQVRH